MRRRRFSGIDQNLMNLSSEPVARRRLSGEKQTLRIYGSLFVDVVVIVATEDEGMLELSSAERDADADDDTDDATEELEVEDDVDWGEGG